MPLDVVDLHEGMARTTPLAPASLSRKLESMDAQERYMIRFCAARAHLYLQVRLGLCIYFAVGDQVCRARRTAVLAY